MAKAIADTTCPGCGKDHQVEFDLPDPPKAKNVVIEKGHTEIPSMELDSLAEKIAAKMKPKEEKPVQEPKAKKEVEVRLPSWQPKEFCADGSCGAKHTNKHYAQRPKKKCTNCGQFAPAKAAKCAWCDSTDIDPEDRFEELSDDDLNDLGIPLPESEAHEGHNHHDHEQEES